MGTARLRCVGEFGKCGLRCCRLSQQRCQMICILLDHALQGCFAAGAESQQGIRGVGRCSRGVGQRGGSSFENRVGIGAAQAERTDTGQPFGGWPGLGRCWNHKRQIVPRDMGIGCFEMHLGGDQAMLQGEHHLHHASDACCGFSVADVGFHGADPQRLGSLTKHCAQGVKFNWVAQGGPCTMCFDIADFICCHMGVDQRLADQFLLADAVGHGQAAAVAVMVDGCTTYNCQNRVAILLCCREGFEDDNPTPIAARVAICSGRKGFAPAIGSKDTSLCGKGAHKWMQDQVDAAGQC